MVIHRIGGALVLASLAGAQGIRVSGPLARPVGVHVKTYRVTSDGARVVYAADQDEDEHFELFAAPADGGKGPQRISPPFPAELDVVPRSLCLSPDDRWAVFQVEDEFGDGSLWSARLDGSSAVLLARAVPSFELDPSSAWVLFRDWDARLFRVPLDGSLPPAELGGPWATNGGVVGFGFAPRSARVVFVADRDTPFTRELFSVPIDGSGPAVKLSGPMVSGGGVGANSFLGPIFRITPDETRVVYGADQEVSTPAHGRTHVRKLNGPLAEHSGGVSHFTIAPRSVHVLFLAPLEVFSSYELLRAPIDGSQPALRLSAPLAEGGSVAQFALTADESRVVYRADQEADRRDELFSVPADGSASPLRLHPPFAGNQRALGFALAPDGERVVYLAYQDSVLAAELYAAPVDGSSAPVKLSGAQVSGGQVADFRIAPDGARVVYRADALVWRQSDLFSVPLDASLAPQQLNTAWAADGDVWEYELSADSRWVVYRGNQDHPRGEHFSAPIDGGAPAVKLNLSATAPLLESSVFFPAISPDSRRVVFLADDPATSGLGLQLFSAPIDGREDPLLLSAPGRDVDTALLAADGTRVLYWSGGLWSVPVDGSADPLALYTPQAWSFPAEFAPAPRGPGALLVADHPTPGTHELFELSALAPFSPRRVNAPFQPSGGLASWEDGGTYTFSLDAEWVLYRADQDVDEVFELYLSRLGARRPVSRF